MKDFKKQKIKLGRSLKPATNSTDTTFKTKKINVPVQTLKKNIKDLFSKSLISKRELLEIIDCGENQNLIWNSLLNCILGDAVRRKLLKSSWKEIIEKLDSKPFLALITTHLNCALCHVDKSIRLDALEILENTNLEDASPGILRKITTNLLEILDQKSSNARLMILTQVFKMLDLQFKRSDLLPWEQSCFKFASSITYVADQGFINLEENLNNDVNSSQVAEIQKKLLPFLLNYWVESFVVLEKEIIQDSNELKILHVILKIMGLLGKLGSNKELITLKSCLEKFKGFPFGRDRVRESAIIKDMNWDFSIVSCQVQINTKQIVKYLLQFLTDSSGEVLELDKVDGMLLVIWEILKNNEEERVEILEKLFRFKVVDRSNMIYEKKFDFLSFLITEIDGNRFDQGLKQNDRVFKESRNWVFSLPRKIWELKTNNIALTRKILEFLLRIFQKNMLDVCYDQGLEKFQLSLIPLFHVVSLKGDLFGPFKSYTLDCQHMLLNLLFYLPEINHKLLISIVSCLTNISVRAETVVHFMDIVYERQSRCKVPLEKHVYASVCTTLLVGYSSKEINYLQNHLSLPSQGFYGMEDCLAVKRKLSKSTQKHLASKEEYINNRAYIVKRIFYAFGPFLEELPKIIDSLAASVLPLDSIFCFCLALANVDPEYLLNSAQMVTAIKNDEELKVCCKTY